MPPRSGDFSIEVGRNVIHGSDSVESAQRELGLWFPEGLVDNTPVLLGQVRAGCVAPPAAPLRRPFGTQHVPVAVVLLVCRFTSEECWPAARRPRMLRWKSSASRIWACNVQLQASCVPAGSMVRAGSARLSRRE